jgi:hypothetical protein
MAQTTLPRARLVLADATEATERLRERVASGGNYRIDWAGTVALLRMVGHVLHKVDAQANPSVARYSPRRGAIGTTVRDQSTPSSASSSSRSETRS